MVNICNSGHRCCPHSFDGEGEGGRGRRPQVQPGEPVLDRGAPGALQGGLPEDLRGAEQGECSDSFI